MLPAMEYSDTQRNLRARSHSTYGHSHGFSDANSQMHSLFAGSDTPLNDDQLKVLNEAYEHDVFPSLMRCSAIGKMIGIPARRVQIWLQNQHLQVQHTRQQPIAGLQGSRPQPPYNHMSTGQHQAHSLPSPDTTDGESLPQTPYHFSTPHKPPQYSEVSEIFSELEYRQILASYDICGFNAWKIVSEDPTFRTRGLAVQRLCERLENYKIAHWKRHTHDLRALVNERVNDWASHTSLSFSQNMGEPSFRKPSTGARTKRKRRSKASGSAAKLERGVRGHALQPKGLKQDPRHSMTSIKETETAPDKEESREGGHSSEEYEALLTHLESLKSRQPSPTSSSSSYASASSSVRSRSSWSTDANEFPFSFRPVVPDIRETSWSVGPDGPRLPSPPPLSVGTPPSVPTAPSQRAPVYTFEAMSTE
ncbi:hypothetical protein HYPSUDRAFT_35705 [Hypholoma sublateritium FD-334 SS-4]|uniref:Homeobox domain-containing protein n=1 Tax=Hypholoma sublateritium (strain FD-334 SS-4) TaxID=945553 RepID=A0A0D2P822_HYPSF|nr:hypothetical protein HYPSUDRAFT_35705 [Hypholoma sublateritium FD-334 SS-4]